MSFNATNTQSMAPDERRAGVVTGLRHSTTGEIYSLEDGRRRWVIGSDPNSDIQLDDRCVSGTHCIVERKPGGGLIVRDRNSKNGTYLDGSRIEGGEVRVGSYLSVGRTTLVAVAPGGSPDKRPAVEMLKGHDPTFRRMIEQAVKAAQTDCSVLVLGETGTGKDLVARLIHEHSRRSAGAYVPVNCGAIPRELIASELFGHEKGSFTGATEGRDGYFVEAHNGTLFLDEMGELPIELQPNLLRVLESRRVRRVGGQSERAVDVRIVAATNRTDNLGTPSSRLRVDLYHRLAVVVLMMPPLRARIGDLPELVDSMLEDFEAEYGPKELTESAWHALCAYSWPGNIRELRQAVQRAVALGGQRLEPRDFFPDLGPQHRRPMHMTSTLPLPAAPAGAGDGGDGGDDHDPLRPYQEMLRGAMAQSLEVHGTIRAAARSLGMPKSTFADKAKQWGLISRRRPPRFFKK